MTRRRKTLIILFALVIAALILLALARWRGALPALSKRSTPAVNLSAETPLPAATGTLPPNPQNPVPPFAEDDPSNAPYTCVYTPAVDALRADLSAEQWLPWIELLSGAKPVELNGESYTIQTRYTESLFNGDPAARAFEFVHDQLLLWGYLSQETLFVEDYLPFDDETETPWKNLIAVIPGTDPQLAQQEILLTAHLDSLTAAALVLENFMTQDASSGCGEIDRNPNYHTEGDLASEINPSTAFDIAQAAILTTAAIAEPEGH